MLIFAHFIFMLTHNYCVPRAENEVFMFDYFFASLQFHKGGHNGANIGSNSSSRPQFIVVPPRHTF